MFDYIPAVAATAAAASAPTLAATARHSQNGGIERHKLMKNKEKIIGCLLNSLEWV